MYSVKKQRLSEVASALNLALPEVTLNYDHRYIHNSMKRPDLYFVYEVQAHFTYLGSVITYHQITEPSGRYPDQKYGEAIHAGDDIRDYVTGNTARIRFFYQW